MHGMDLRQVDLNLLVALDRLLETGNVTEAARALSMTQPAMSRTLQRLREVTHDPLFVRVGRGLVPTDRARALVEPVRAALKACQTVFEEPTPFEPATATGSFRLALGDESQVALADAIVRAVWSAAPFIDLRFHGLSASSVDEGKRGTFDFALAPDLSRLPARAGAPDLSEFVLKQVYVRRFVVIARRGTLDGLTIEQYLERPHVIVSFEGGARGFVDDLLDAQGLRRRVAASVTSFPSAASLVARTNLLATLPEEAVAATRLGVTAFHPPLDLPEIPMLGIWHPRNTTDKRHRFLRELTMQTVSRRARRRFHLALR